MSRNQIIIILFLFFGNSLFSQTIISGIVKSQRDSVFVSDAYIMIKNLKNNKLLSYTVSGKNGQFKFDKYFSKGIYRIKVHHQAYNAWQIDILIDSLSQKHINLPVYLIDKNEQLQEVVIDIQKPVVVKKDTIIYNISRLKNANDEDLESVLRRMDGIEISKDGEITIKHKKIQKVLIDGKEVSNTGAALITKSIDPDKVAKIEVRFKEKDTKLKESLLNGTDYAVLDIKLKHRFKNSVFGKIRASQTYQDTYLQGGYSNIFSLREKLKIHFFGEYAPMGEKIISLHNIKNIGREAMSKLFERPTDYNEIVEKQGYINEIYGFKDYTTFKSGITGLTLGWDTGKKWYLFVGSFNEYNDIAQKITTTQLFFPENQLSYNLTKPRQIFSSKNKIEIRFDNTNNKFSYDGNFIYENQDITKNLNFNNENNYINFNHQLTTHNWYQNLLYEHKINDFLGWDIKANYSRINQNGDINYQHNSADISLFFIQDSTQTANFLLQFSNQKFRDYYLSTAIHYNNDKFELIDRLLFQKRHFTFRQSLVNQDTGNIINDFSQPDVSYRYSDIQNQFFFSFNANNFFVNSKFTSGYILHIDPDQTDTDAFYVNFKAAINYRNDHDFDTGISFDSHLRNYSLLKQVMVRRIVDYDLIQIPKTNNPMTRERLIEFSLDKNFLFMDLTLAILNGKSINRYELTTSGIFFTLQKPGVSETSYNMISTALKKKIGDLKFILEPEYIYHITYNQTDELHISKSNIWLLGLIVKYLPVKKAFNFNFYPKYTRFEFKNDLASKINFQNMFSTKAEISYQIIPKKLNIHTGFRYISFDGLSKANYYNVDIGLKGKFKKFFWKFQTSNLTNDQNFYTQVDTPLYLLINKHQIFARNFIFSLSYVF